MFSPDDIFRIRQIVREEIKRDREAQQGVCKHTYGQMHDDGSVTCVNCMKLLTEARNANL